jgi:putative Holliday junction resolvase
VTRILGLDYGKRRIGVAVSDPLGVTAQPLEIWNARDWNGIFTKVTTLIEEMGVERVIVGFPISLSGERGAMAKEVEKFAQKLHHRVNIPVDLCDERLTSIQAERYLRQMNVKYTKQKHKVDIMAAVIILQHYLDQKKGSEFKQSRDIP